MLRRVVMFIAYFELACNGQGAARPVILNLSETASGGDLIYLQGSDFGVRPFVQYAYNDSIWYSAKLITVGNGVVTVKLPGSETKLPDLITLRISSDNIHWSSIAYVNQAIPMSYDTDQIAPASPFRIFGRNLYFPGRTPTVRFVDAANGSSQAAVVNTVGSTHYSLQVTAPAGIQAAHTYRLYVSNGYSGNATAVVESLAADSLTGRGYGIDFWQLGLPWAADFKTYSNVYDVKTDPRLGDLFATGNGIADDTWPIDHAVEVAAAAGGGVVFLPAGNYTLHFANGCGITLLPGVVLQGASSSTTSINYGYPVGTLGGYGICFANQSGLINITVNNVDQAKQWQSSALSINNSEVFLKGVIWNIGTSQWMSFIGDDHVVIENSIISQGNDNSFNYLGPLNLQGCSHCEVSNTVIQFTVGGILLDHASDIVFQGNQVIRDISLPPSPSSVTHSVEANFVKNLVVLDNTFYSVGGSLPTNNDGEVIASEGGGPIRSDEFRGTITSASATTLTDLTQNFFQSSNSNPSLEVGIATVAIIGGNGLGQWRTVTEISIDGTTLTVDHPWDVEPDIGSNYATFDWSAWNWTVVSNSLTGNFKGFEIFDASAANLLFEMNKLTDSDGIMISPSEQPQGATSAALFNVVSNLSIIGNTLTDRSGLRPAYVALVPREDQQTASFGTHVIGATIKANTVTAFVPNVFDSPPSWDDYKVVTEGFLCDYYWQSPSNYNVSTPPPLIGTIFQGNLARNSSSAFYLNSGAVATAIGDTLIENVGAIVADVPISGASQSSEDTTIQDSLAVFSVGSASASSTDMFQGSVSPAGGRAVAIGHQGVSSYALSSAGDNLNLLGQELAANEYLVAHVTLESASATGAITMRNTASPQSPFVSIGLRNGQMVLNSRLSVGGALQSTTLAFSGDTAWLELKKAGPIIVAMYSNDGKSWTSITSLVNFVGSKYLAGVLDLSSGGESSIEVTFDSITFNLLEITRSSSAR